MTRPTRWRSRWSSMCLIPGDLWSISPKPPCLLPNSSPWWRASPELVCIGPAPGASPRRVISVNGCGPGSPTLPIVVGCWGGLKDEAEHLARLQLDGIAHTSTTLLETRNQIGNCPGYTRPLFSSCAECGSWASRRCCQEKSMTFKDLWELLQETGMLEYTQSATGRGSLAYYTTFSLAPFWRRMCRGVRSPPRVTCRQGMAHHFQRWRVGTSMTAATSAALGIQAP